MNEDLIKRYEDCFLSFPTPEMGLTGYFAIIDNANEQAVINFAKYNIIRKVEQIVKSTVNGNLIPMIKYEEINRVKRNFRSIPNRIEEIVKYYEHNYLTENFTHEFIKTDVLSLTNYLFSYLPKDLNFVNHLSVNNKSLFESKDNKEQSVANFKNNFEFDFIQSKKIKKVLTWSPLTTDYKKLCSYDIFEDIYYVSGETFIIQYENDSNIYVFAIGLSD